MICQVFLQLCSSSKKLQKNIKNFKISIDKGKNGWYNSWAWLRDAGVAQLVEQLICNQQVGGSSPSTSSTLLWVFNRTRSLRGWAALRKYHGVMFLGAKCEAAVTRARQTFEKRMRPSTSSTLFREFNKGDFPSGQRGQTVNLLAKPSVVRIHHLPPSVVVYLDATQKSLEKSRLFAFLTPIF